MKLSAGWFRALIFILNPDGNICISPTVVLCEGFFVLLAPVNIANLRNPLKLIFSIMPISEHYEYDRKIQKSQPGASFQRAVMPQRLFASRACVCLSLLAGEAFHVFPFLFPLSTRSFTAAVTSTRPLASVWAERAEQAVRLLEMPLCPPPDRTRAAALGICAPLAVGQPGATWYPLLQTLLLCLVLSSLQRNPARAKKHPQSSFCCVAVKKGRIWWGCALRCWRSEMLNDVCCSFIEILLTAVAVSFS